MRRELRWLLDGRCERITKGERRYVGYLDGGNVTDTALQRKSERTTAKDDRHNLGERFRRHARRGGSRGQGGQATINMSPHDDQDSRAMPPPPVPILDPEFNALTSCLKVPVIYISPCVLDFLVERRH
jgi:hypothetical protein